jgi:hypothetical protein
VTQVTGGGILEYRAAPRPSPAPTAGASGPEMAAALPPLRRTPPCPKRDLSPRAGLLQSAAPRGSSNPGTQSAS